jgi:Na+/melibiose symporter-like transporter
MGIRQQWHAATQVMAREKDERSELANLRIARDVLISILTMVVLLALALLAAPLSDQERAFGLPLILVGIVLVGGITYRVSRKRNRVYSREYERAESFKALVLWLPLSILTAAAALLLTAVRLSDGPWSPTLTPSAVGVGLGIAIAASLEYRRYRSLAR